MYQEGIALIKKKKKEIYLRETWTKVFNFALGRLWLKWYAIWGTTLQKRHSALKTSLTDTNKNLLRIMRKYLGNLFEKL